MTTVTISNLPTASTPLDGTETLPIVKSGVTDKVSVANLTAGRAVSALSLDVNSGSTSLTANFNSTNANAGYVSFQSSSTNYGFLGSGASLSTANATDLTVRSQNNLTFATGGGTEKMRIGSAGGVAIGTATTTLGQFTVTSSGAVPTTYTRKDSTTIAVNYVVNSLASGKYFEWEGNGSVNGAISFSGSMVSYTSVSDYRLKENVQSMTDALAKIEQLNPVTFNWKQDGTSGQGFIAHELQVIFPDAVTGEKDAVDENGKEQYQGVDTSFLVATLVAAVKELAADNQQLRARVEALETAQTAAK